MRAKKGLRLTPIKINSNSWAFEETNGIGFYSDVETDRSRYRGLIPIATIRAYVRRVGLTGKKK